MIDNCENCGHVLTENESGICDGCSEIFHDEIDSDPAGETYRKMLAGAYTISSGF